MHMFKFYVDENRCLMMKYKLLYVDDDWLF